MASNRDVDAFLDGLDHPRRADIDELRALIRSADPRLREGIKWNAPSFAVADDLITFKLHPPATLALVFHTGAKRRAAPITMSVPDPGGLLQWAAPDRALVALADAADIRAKADALVALAQAWIGQVSAADESAAG